MPTAPPSFTGGAAPQVGRLPAPIDSARPLAEGVDALARSVTGAADSIQATDDRARESDLQVARIKRERELQLRTGDSAAYIAGQQGNLQADLIQLRTASDPGGAGHEQQVNDRIAKFRDDVTTHLGNDPELVDRFVDNIATIAANARVGELEWAAKQSAAKSVTDIATLDDHIHNNLRTAVTNGTFKAQMVADADALRGRAIDAQPVDGNTKAKMKQDGHLGDLISTTEAYIDTNPHAALQWIDGGRTDELPDQVRDQLRTRARVAADRLDNQAKEAANEGAAVERAHAGNLVEDVNKGVHVDTGALQGAYDRAAASEKPEDIRLAHDLKTALAKNAVTAKYDNSTDDERLAAARAIEGQKDWQKDPQLVAAHEQLGTLIARDQHAAEADPLPLYARQTGQTLPALDLADPKAMGLRFLLGDRAATRFPNIRPTYFTEDEAKEMRQHYNAAPPVGKAQFIAQLAAFGPTRARAMMRQIAPNNPAVARLTELATYSDPAIKSLVIEASDGAAQPMKDGTAAAVRSQALRDWGPALAGMPGDRAQAAMQVATWIYAHRAAASAKAGHFDRDLARQSVVAALGGAGGKGGIGYRSGSAMVLPTGVSQHDFDAILASASGAELVKAANGGAYWRTDEHLTDRELKGLVPVLVTDSGTQSLYKFRSKGGSGYVKTQRGDDFVLDFRRLLPIVKAGDGTLDAQLAAHGYVRR